MSTNVNETGSPQPGQPRSAIIVDRDAPLKVILEHRGRLGRWGGRWPWIITAIAVLVAMSAVGSYRNYFQTNPQLQEKFHSLEETSSNKIAIIKIEGTIMGSDGFVKWQIDRAREDKEVKAVVLHIDSPGGTVTGSDNIYHQLTKLTKERDIPIVVSMGGIAASGGYYVAMAVGDQEDTIFAEPATWTGSIGVIIPHYNLVGLLENWHVRDDSISSEPMKKMGSPTFKFDPIEAKKQEELLKGLVMESFAEFKEVVKSGRPKLRKDEKLLAQATTGQVFNAKQALKLGLIDKLGYMDDAIARAVQLAKLTPKTARAVSYSKPKGVLDDVLIGASSSSESTRLTALLDLSVPRAYYLYGMIPALVSSRAQ